MAAVNRRPLVAVLAAAVVSQIGSQLTIIAIPWYVLVTTGSAARTGLVGFFSLSPVILSVLYSGRLVNRLGFRRASVLTDLAGGLAVGLVPLLAGTLGLAFWQLLALVFLASLALSPGQAARQSLFPDLARLAGVPLTRANSLAAAIRRLSLLLGAPLAGVLIVWLGARQVLWLDAASFALSAAIIGLLVPDLPLPAVESKPAGQRHPLAGLRAIRRDPLIALLLVASTVGNARGAALFDVALPVYARVSTGQATAVGLMLGAFGAGALLSSLAYAAAGERLPLRGVLAGSQLLAAIPFWLLVAVPPLSVSVPALLLYGLASGPFGPIVSTIYQQRVAPELRGDFFALVLATDNLSSPLAVLLAGGLIQRSSLPVALGAIALVSTVQTALVVRRSALAELTVDRVTGGPD